MRVQGEGPIPARLMIVGEAPGEQEERLGTPFVGSSGQELNRLFQEVGIMRSEVYVTNVCKLRPPNNYLEAWMPKAKKDIRAEHKLLRDRYVSKEVVDGYNELWAEIDMVKPNLIVAFGNLAMWALTGNWGILKWRGSLLRADRYDHKSYAVGGSNIGFEKALELSMTPIEQLPKVIPTIHPAAILREWSMRAVVLNDLRRVRKHMISRVYDNRPVWNFSIRPSFDAATSCLQSLYDKLRFGGVEWIDLDIETRPGLIESIGLSWSKSEAICIPFIARGHPDGYWTADEEAKIVWMLYQVLTHKAVKIRWQNGLYDAQYIHRYWHFIPRGVQDTMISQHSLFAALPKSLAFIASMYADWYVYWKDEGKIASDAPEERRWQYNLQDCVYTRIVGEALTQAAGVMGLASVDAGQQALFYPVLSAMIRGVKVIPAQKEKMAQDIQEELSKREAFLYNILGHKINVASPLQMKTLFYEDLKQPPILKRVLNKATNRYTMNPTCDDEALQKIAAREPLLRPITNAIADIRTLNKFYGDFVLMPLDEDGRMRCSFNIAGDAGGKSAPYSYRLSSSKNPFGSGGNLQTIPSEKSKSSGKAAARGSMDFTLPNIRSMYGPDPGFTFFDMDLDRADLQVVVRESGEADWMAAMDLGVDMHLLNVYTLDKKEPPPYEELVESHPRYWDHRTPRKHQREFAKVFCHATDYVGGAKTVAAHTGRSVHEIDSAQKYWFGAHPGIKKWHERVLDQITKRRFIENRWGYRWYIFDRLEGLLPEAVAWIPQSTIGILINKIWIRFYNELPDVQVLLQVHDSLAGQLPIHRCEVLLPKMQDASQIVIPYENPLIIPTGIKTSTESWGDCA